MSAERPLILVADDNEANRLTLKLELLDRGFVVEEAVDGDDAIAKLAAHDFAAVVTDVWMPGSDGIRVVQAVRKVDGDVPVFVITGGGPGLTLASAATLAEVWGARRVYLKPFDVRELVSDLKAELG